MFPSIVVILGTWNLFNANELEVSVEQSIDH